MYNGNQGIQYKWVDGKFVAYSPSRKHRYDKAFSDLSNNIIGAILALFIAAMPLIMIGLTIWSISCAH